MSDSRYVSVLVERLLTLPHCGDPDYRLVRKADATKAASAISALVQERDKALASAKGWQDAAEQDRREFAALQDEVKPRGDATIRRLLATADTLPDGSEASVAIRVAVDVIREQDEDIAEWGRRLRSEKLNRKVVAELRAEVKRLTRERDAAYTRGYAKGKVDYERD